MAQEVQHTQNSKHSPPVLAFFNRSKVVENNGLNVHSIGKFKYFTVKCVDSNLLLHVQPPTSFQNAEAT